MTKRKEKKRVFDDLRLNGVILDVRLYHRLVTNEPHVRFLLADKVEFPVLGKARIRGKIRREEWPKIIERFRKGETLAEIARLYGCTPPAIRYIVRRADENQSTPEKGIRQSRLQDGSDSGGAQVVSVEARVRTSRPSGEELWERISSDIAAFLAGIDAMSLSDNDENCETMLLAIDRLLRSSARARVEVERLLEIRKGARRKRVL